MSMYAEVQGSTLIRFPYTHGSLMEENPFTNYGNDPDLPALFPETQTAIENGYTLVEVTVLPEPNVEPRTYRTQQQSPSLKDGVWVIDWDIIPKSNDEIAADTATKATSVRADRNSRLTACDWTQLPDAPTDKAAWATYRQALRDISLQVGFPWNVSWPAQP